MQSNCVKQPILSFKEIWGQMSVDFEELSLTCSNEPWQLTSIYPWTDATHPHFWVVKIISIIPILPRVLCPFLGCCSMYYVSASDVSMWGCLKNKTKRCFKLKVGLISCGVGLVKLIFRIKVYFNHEITVSEKK